MADPMLRVAVLMDLATQLREFAFTVDGVHSDGASYDGPVLECLIKFRETRLSPNCWNVYLILMDRAGKLRALGLAAHDLAGCHAELATEDPDLYKSVLKVGEGADRWPLLATFEDVPSGTEVYGIRLYIRPALSPQPFD